ncbi:MAG TPA: cation transporter [Ignavibacteriaceae bacterium]|nr:cation transporter [Ignavibacteriaceae bacterium]
MKTEKIEIKGMSCMHCVKAVKDELSKLNINVKNVGIGSAEVEYKETDIKREDILKAIKEAGYVPVD